MSIPFFRNIKLRTKKPECIACGTDRKRLTDQSDYLELCGRIAPDYEALGLDAGDARRRLSAKVGNYYLHEIYHLIPFARLSPIYFARTTQCISWTFVHE